ncbi:CPBP family intramembrane metalloprotease [Brevibacillus agri]|uniref:CPBP family intramembrane glutamic endopeptidase n=1 Tax=Brevibacillus agri TaxID=51101 RepID=UPI001EE62A2D|nr:CPBP family intramembrane glutamic endopeptidase [Brevibacillus agri]MCG5253321.1 CPBP family intramembrane metalloprotease [Brevibacillus agri]MDN4096032.1 CPBP family intramembrane metalloprotease [Brevibacillus agri]MDR9506048.1 CPBP family intramembrane glutamic endopeptidase [Brevibacillus agri]MED1644929.1 CPBP family intramembrane metalloprotease [Brevibacillus agri]MED1653921.1 CPBP family intramembrane metalloprotease [Brevibacillus agri]
MKNLKIALFLSGLSAIGFVAATPYLLTMIGDAVAMVPLPLPAVIALFVLQGSITAFLLSWAGLTLAGKVGLDAPILRKWLYKTGGASFNRQGIVQAVIFGLLGTLMIYLLERLIFQPLMPILAEKAQELNAPIWAGVLTAIQGGVYEEVMVRLFMMTLVVWILSKLFGRQSSPKPWMYWIGIFGAAFLFGLGHLPAASVYFGEITPLLFVRTIALNGVAGILFGYLYWKRGLEYAMIAHAIGDILLHGFLS